jgi:hypothetical protein
MSSAWMLNEVAPVKERLDEAVVWKPTKEFGRVPATAVCYLVLISVHHHLACDAVETRSFPNYAWSCLWLAVATVVRLVDAQPPGKVDLEKATTGR